MQGFYKKKIINKESFFYLKTEFDGFYLYFSINHSKYFESYSDTLIEFIDFETIKNKFHEKITINSTINLLIHSGDDGIYFDIYKNNNIQEYFLFISWYELKQIQEFHSPEIWDV